jgi:hypothetical protein
METEVLLSPQEAADRTGVHLRTIFRWVERGHLTSTAGKVKQSEIERIKHELENSVPKLQIRKEFGVCCATIRSWKKNGIVEMVCPLGAERILKSSYEKIKATKLGRRVRYHPDYVPVNDLLLVTGLEASKLNEFLDKRVVRSKRIKGRRMIPRKVYEYYKKLMDETMRPTDVERVLQISKDKRQGYSRTGRLREVEVLGRVRIACDSVAQTPEEKRRLKMFLAERRRGRKEEESQRRESERVRIRKFEQVRIKAEKRRSAAKRKKRRQLRRAKEVEARRLEAERLRAESKLMREREVARLKQKRLKARREKKARRERARARRAEEKRLEAERRQAEKLERRMAKKAERDRLRAERLEAKRLETERFKAERRQRRELEANRRRAQRLEEKKERTKQRQELKKQKDAEAEARRVEAERLRAEVEERERLEAEAARIAREEAERAEAERLRRQKQLEQAFIQPITVRALGTLKVFTIEQAVRRLKMSKFQVQELAGKGVLRIRFVGEKMYIIAASLIAYEGRVKK